MAVVGEGDEENAEWKPPSGSAYTPYDNTPRPKRRREPQTARLKDIIGHGPVKVRIEEMILPLGLPRSVLDSVFTGIRSIPTSIFLHGPPGCGKVRSPFIHVSSRPLLCLGFHLQTQLARAIAGEARAALISVAPSDVLSKFVGDSEAAIRNVFRRAVQEGLELDSKCAVVFFDEIDALGQNRENMGTGEGEGCSRRVLTELLLQLNTIADRKYCTLHDFEGSEKQDAGDDEHNYFGEDEEEEVLVIVVAATNRRDDCDHALLRRFGIVLEVAMPLQRDRKKMLQKHLNTVNHSISESQFELLASVTDDWSGSYIEKLCRDSAMVPVQECLRKAATVRRKCAKREQSSGSTSTEGEDSANITDPDLCAENCLRGGLEKLRPVSVSDCIICIEAMTGVDVSIAFRQQKKRLVEEHYDSSSSEEYRV